MKKLLYIYIVFIAFSSFSQKKEELDSIPPNFEDYIFAKPGDTITVQLNAITLLPKQNFKSREDIRYYLWFRRKVFKAYPYAKLASTRLDSLNARLSRITTNSKRKKYTKQIQKYIEGEFTDQIKKMTRTEGRILIKLIHRQTGKTAFDNIKELRSGWKAFWYNTTANVFDLSLKQEYHPAVENEDFLIEDILQRAFQDEILKRQDSKLNFDFAKIIALKKATINVEVYKAMFAKMRKKRKKKKRKTISSSSKINSKS
ncbi:DUF4294 domain-containing protein [Polaribacter sp. R77954]|uniref:DUF4294 domain-containing protein n=1 Tax=Polaribacter sp. R77954 TaxID=3093870 RepID=UPI0037C847DF